MIIDTKKYVIVDLVTGDCDKSLVFPTVALAAKYLTVMVSIANREGKVPDIEESQFEIVEVTECLIL